MNNKIIAIGGTALGLAVGSVAGYLFAKRQLEQSYVELAQKEIAEARAYYNQLHKKGEEFETPGAVLQRRVPAKPNGVDDRIHEGPSDEVLEKVLNGLRYHTDQPIIERPLEIMHGHPQSIEEEDAARSADAPYVLDIDEFMNSEVGYTNMTVTYFVQDGVLVDESDDIIEDIENWVGHYNLNRFGHRSNDQRIVYVRNERLEFDLEVIRDEGSYAELVAGFAPEQKNRKTRK